MTPLPPAMPTTLTFRGAVGDLPPTAVQPGQTVAYATEPQNDFQRRMRGTTTFVREHHASRHGPQLLALMAYIPEGKSARNPEVYQAIPANLRPGGCYPNSYARIYWDRPAPTITSNSGTPSSANCIHPAEPRALTIREAARCQSFRDSYQFVGTNSQKRLQIGNAVPPILAEKLGWTLRAMLDGAATTGTLATQTVANALSLESK